MNFRRCDLASMNCRCLIALSVQKVPPCLDWKGKDWVGDKGKEQKVEHYRFCVDSNVWVPGWENIPADRF